MAEKKYGKKALAEAVDRYFRSISRTVTVTEKVDSGDRDDKGHVIWKSIPVVNDLGEECKAVEYIVPPTVGGLSEYLGIHRSTWWNYCDPEKHPEHIDTTTRARGRMRAYLERELLTRPGKDVRGVMFELENNHGLSEKHSVEMNAKASVDSMTLDEREQLLREIAGEWGT